MSPMNRSLARCKTVSESPFSRSSFPDSRLLQCCLNLSCEVDKDDVKRIELPQDLGIGG